MAPTQPSSGCWVSNRNSKNCFATASEPKAPTNFPWQKYVVISRRKKLVSQSYSPVGQKRTLQEIFLVYRAHPVMTVHRISAADTLQRVAKKCSNFECAVQIRAIFRTAAVFLINSRAVGQALIRLWKAWEASYIHTNRHKKMQEMLHISLSILARILVQYLSFVCKSLSSAWFLISNVCFLFTSFFRAYIYVCVTFLK
jgi:hypothetical protein